MVGGLVEQQHVGLHQQDFGKFDTHAPTARELARGALEVGTLKAQANQRALYLGLITFGTHHLIALMSLGIAFHQVHIFRRFIVGALREFAVHPLQPLSHLRMVGKGLAGFLAHRGIVHQLHHLRQIAHSGVVGNAYHARRRLLKST